MSFVMVSLDSKYHYRDKNFMLALTVSEILTFQMFNLEKVGQGQGRGGQLLQWSHSMETIKNL